MKDWFNLEGQLDNYDNKWRLSQFRHLMEDWFNLDGQLQLQMETDSI